MYLVVSRVDAPNSMPVIQAGLLYERLANEKPI